MASLVTLEELIQAGVHFGHRCSRWNPKMSKYIYGKRNQIHIIDLRHTVRGLIRGSHFLERLVQSGGEVLLVGTKPQVRTLVKAEAERCGMHYVSERWLGGTLTNHMTIRSRLDRLHELEEIERSGGTDRFTKKTWAQMSREKKKLLRNLDGIRRMNKLPQALIIIDPRREESALQEASKMGIPTVCVIDTDSDPGKVDIAIPANDDAYRSVQVILSRLVDGIRRGRQKLNVASGVAKKGGSPKSSTPPPAPEPASATAGEAETATP
ncbi:MAG: 30S ribosomal protein S2 [Planctomycetes bacterium]|nr:30S ribosomal protein S2 [Planctomycetota bacterium]